MGKAEPRRVLSLWLPRWPTDRLYRAWRRHGASGPARGRPLALTMAQQGTQRIAAVNRAAAAEGVCPGLLLTDARALVPGLSLQPAAPAADARALAALADWCSRYSPWAAVDGADGVRLDVTGCGHLFGGEGAMLDDLLARLEDFGIDARATIAEIRPSRSKPDRGIVKTFYEVFNQNGERVMTVRGIGMFARRPEDRVAE